MEMVIHEGEWFAEQPNGNPPPADFSGVSMAILDCPIHKNDWAHEIGLRNGAAGSPAEKCVKADAKDAGAWEPTVQ
jgi:hypothetical protein